jgi:hypothetical protein
LRLWNSEERLSTKSTTVDFAAFKKKAISN